jgi:DNA (cytosine-5)-methyltransferase 1
LNALFGDADVNDSWRAARLVSLSLPMHSATSWMARWQMGLSTSSLAWPKARCPDVITMENVPTVAKHEVFHDFVDTLKRLGYNVWFDVVDSSRYGVPQTAPTYGAAGI